MPTYEYACVQCGNRFDIFRRIGDEPLRICDVCGGDLRKVFHPAGIVFKGSGFYKTDSRQASGKGEKKPASSSSEGSGEKSAEPKGDKGSSSSEKPDKSAKPDKKEATS
jgi:putative FmdB family regulatory protein